MGGGWSELGRSQLATLTGPRGDDNDDDDDDDDDDDGDYDVTTSGMVPASNFIAKLVRGNSHDRP